MSGIKCVFLTPSGKLQPSLRVYTTHGGECLEINNCGYHQAVQYLPLIIGTEDSVSSCKNDLHEYKDKWPTKCKCEYLFDKQAERQYRTETLYFIDGGPVLTTLHKAPVGAMWYSPWLGQDAPDECGTDGKALVVKTLGGDWHIDGVCSNCTKPNNKEHRCWVRHGVPPNITVDKNGNTCSAGAGSISIGKYHGFLRNGFLTE